MKVLIQKVRIIDPLSPFNEQQLDILIDSGTIVDINDRISIQADHVINIENLHCSPGWIDVFSNFNDPGFEFKETLETGAAAAAAGGYTEVFVIPNTQPIIDTKSQTEYISRRSRTLPVTIHPIGAVTKNAEGKELAEMYDMRASGAIAFSDGLNPVQSAGLLLKALQYVKAFEGVIIQLPDDKSVGVNGLIHEGIISTRLGLPGKPMMAEELLVARDIKLTRYSDSRIHFTGITSPRSLEYIRRAKEAGLHVTCSVTPYHLHFTDNALVEYDTNLKVYPPLRTNIETELLQKAVEEGTVDCIASHHMPHEYDSKVLEFEYAKFGMTGLETTYAVLKKTMPGVSERAWVEMLCLNPRKIFNLPVPCVKKDERCSLTLFDPSGNWTYTETNVKSKSRNSPFLNTSFTGQVIGIINGEQVFLKI